MTLRNKSDLQRGGRGGGKEEEEEEEFMLTLGLQLKVSEVLLGLCLLSNVLCGT